MKGRVRGGRLFAGLLLAVSGAVLLAPRWLDVQQAPLWLLGVGVLGAVFGIVRRSNGWVEGGMIALGLGAGMLLGDVGVAGIPKGAWLPLALGGALLLAWAIVRLGGTRGRWWPLLPAVLLLALAAARIAGSLAWRLPPALEEGVRAWWPAALVLLGIIIIFSAFHSSR